MQNESVVPVIKDENEPNAKLVFKPSSWLVQIDYINQLLRLNTSLIAVLAEAASGKTTFISLLQKELEPTIKSHVIKAIDSCSEAEFLSELQTAFELKAEKESKFSNLVAQVNEKQAPVLVIIDDTQNLPDSFLQEMLSELKNQTTNNFFHLCLVADFSLAASLFQLEGELIPTLELGNLTAVEAKTYLRSVLPESSQLDKILTSQGLEQFYETTKGNIARINAHKETLLKSVSMNSDEQGSYFLKSCSYLATAVFAIVAVFYFWQNQMFSSDQVEKAGAYAQPLAEIMQPLPSLIPIITKLHPKKVLVSQLPDINQALLTQASIIPPWYVAAVKQQVQPSPKRIVDIKLSEENDSSLVVRDRVLVIPKAIAGQKTSSQKPAAEKSLKQTKVTDKFYTIQLVASPKYGDIKRFMNENKIKENAQIRIANKQGLDWYVLTIGEYSQLRQAQEAIKNFPDDLIRFHPWIRPVAQLKSLG